MRTFLFWAKSYYDLLQANAMQKWQCIMYECIMYICYIRDILCTNDIVGCTLHHVHDVRRTLYVSQTFRLVL